MSEWISINDSLPKPEVDVLAIVEGFDGVITARRVWERCDPFNEPYYKDYLYWQWVEKSYGDELEDRVKYWMPIPDLPKEPDA